MYNIKDSPFISQLRNLSRKNKVYFQSPKHELIELIEDQLNIQHKIACHYANWFLDESILSPI